MAKRHDTDAIERALLHHQLAGVVRNYSPPYPGRPEWLIDLGEGHQPYTTAQAWAICQALAAVERMRVATAEPPHLRGTLNP